MGTETLPDSTTVAAGLVIKSADFLTTNAAMQGAFVGRNTSGVPASGQSLGTALYPWGNAYVTDLVVNGSSIDFSGISAESNRIVSGKTRSTSGQPYFLNPAGSAATVTILGAATDLIVDINGTLVTISADIAETGLTTAPSSNNTCAINDGRFTDQAASKYFGEHDSLYPTITIDTVGSEISSLVGQMIALKTSSSEVMFGWLKSATEFTNVKRGFFFDSSNNPIVRETLADNDTLTLMKTGWIFITNDGTTADVSYLTPVISFASPSSPVTGQYWYDLTNSVWKRYSGADFVTINRMLLGVAIIDTTNCIAARSFDFYKDFKDDNTIELEIFDDEIIRTKKTDAWINVYGSELRFTNGKIGWDNTSDLETGSVAASTTYYIYLSENGQKKISLERPYDRPDLRGKYHPYNNWRCVGEGVTDSSSDWGSVKTDVDNVLSNTIADDLSESTNLGKNVLYNPNFGIWQRGTSFAAIASGAYSVDRFQYSNVGSTSVHTISRDTDVPTQVQSGWKSNYSAKIDCTTADAAVAAGDLVWFEQKIEGYNYKQFEGNTATLSFWVKATKTGTYCVAFNNGGLDRCYTAEYTVNSSDTWEKKTITLTFDYTSGGTWDYINGVGLRLAWVLMAGTTYHGTNETWTNSQIWATSNQVNACDNTANNFFLSQVQFELGSAATDFEQRSIGDEKLLCERYYQKSYQDGSAPGTATQLAAYVATFNAVANADYTAEAFVWLRPEMRTNPTVTLYDSAGTSGRIDMAAGSGIVGSAANLSSKGFRVSGTNGAASTNRTILFHWTANGEL